MKRMILIAGLFMAAVTAKAQDITAPLSQITKAFAAQKKTIDSLRTIIALPVVVTPPPSGTTINVGTGKGALTIDGAKTAYKPGAALTVKPGTYDEINLLNLANVSVNLTGVIFNGDNRSKDGFYNVLTLGKLNAVTLNGGTTQDNGYFMMYVTGQLTAVNIIGMTFKNCAQGIHTDQTLVWDGTDASVYINGLKLINCTFNNAPLITEGALDKVNVRNLIKGLEIAKCNFTNFAGGEILHAAVDGYMFHDNTISNINAAGPINTGQDNDNRMFCFIGNGDAYNNTWTKIQGHCIGVWSCSYGAALKTSHIYDNKVDGSRKYAMFEYHEFDYMVVPGRTYKANAVFDSNTALNLGTDGVAKNGTEFAPTFIDNYAHISPQDGAFGGLVTLTNNKGSNWTPAPRLPVLWNLVAPDTYSNNTYGN